MTHCKAFMGRQASTDDVVRSSDAAEEVQVETSDISNKFKFFETYRAPEKQRKEFRFTPPRDGQVKVWPQSTSWSTFFNPFFNPFVYQLIFVICNEMKQMFQIAIRKKEYSLHWRVRNWIVIFRLHINHETVVFWRILIAPFAN